MQGLKIVKKNIPMFIFYGGSGFSDQKLKESIITNIESNLVM